MNDTPLVPELEIALAALNVLSQNFSTVTGGTINDLMFWEIIVLLGSVITARKTGRDEQSAFGDAIGKIVSNRMVRREVGGRTTQQIDDDARQQALRAREEALALGERALKEREDALLNPLLPPALRGAFADFDEIAEKRFGVDFETLASNPDRSQTAARMRFLVGVALKKDYSDEREIKNREGELIDYKWRINPAKLAATPSDAWPFQLLQAPELQASDPGKDVASRLSRETLLQRCYFEILHPYLCQNPRLRSQIKAILKECGLGEFAGLSSPKGLLKLGVVSLFTFLASEITVLPAAAIAVTALTVGVIGLDRICRNARSRQSGGRRRSTQNC